MESKPKTNLPVLGGWLFVTVIVELFAGYHDDNTDCSCWIDSAVTILVDCFLAVVAPLVVRELRRK
jgi:hypothetical protein